MARGDPLETRILDELARRGPCKLDVLISSLRQFSWNQVFLAVDNLNRGGAVTLRQGEGIGYLVSRRDSVRNL